MCECVFVLGGHWLTNLVLILSLILAVSMYEAITIFRAINSILFHRFLCM